MERRSPAWLFQGRQPLYMHMEFRETVGIYSRPLDTPATGEELCSGPYIRDHDMRVSLEVSKLF